MCRGGKDGKVTRCKVKDTQRAQANIRKKVKYRADKEGVSVEKWKVSHPDEHAAIIQQLLASPCADGFQPLNETRRLVDDIPVLLADHIKLSRENMELSLSSDELKALSGYTGLAASVANTVLMRQSIGDNVLDDRAPLWREAPTAPIDFSTREDLIDYIETMDNILSKRHEDSKVLYRGMPIYHSLHTELESIAGKEIPVTDTESLVGALQEYYKPGKVLEFPSYISTTQSAFYAAERTQKIDETNIMSRDNPEVKGILFEMKTNAGLDVTGAARNFAFEREVVLPRDSRYRIESVALRPESYDTVSGYDRPDDPEQLEQKNYTNLAIVVQMVEVDKEGNELTDTDSHKPSQSFSKEAPSLVGAGDLTSEPSISSPKIPLTDPLSRQFFPDKIFRLSLPWWKK